MTYRIDKVQELKRTTRPVAGEPGVRVDEQGRRYYSAAWLDEALDGDELAARRAERFASLEAEQASTWEPAEESLWAHETIEPWDEAGNVELRVAVALAAVVGVVLVVVLVWQYLVAGAVLVAAARHLTRHTRRRRPKSSWSSLGKTAALMFAAWNSRWLKPSTVERNGRPLRVSVPAVVGREHVDEDGIPF